MTQLRAVGYARVSTEEQVKGYGIAYTSKAITKHTARKGWDLGEIFKDEGLSGTLPWQERDDAKRLMALAQQTPRPFDVVVVYETRAIGRKDRTFYRWWWSLEDLGIAVSVVDKDIDTTTEEGRQALLDEANDAFKEIAKIRKRTQNGLQEKAEDGGHVGGVAPFGYRIEDQGKRGLSRLVIHEADAATLKAAWRLIVKEKKTTEEVAQLLNAAETYGYAGRPWTHASVRHALTKDVIQAGARRFREGGKRATSHEAVTIPLDRIFSELEIAQLNAALERSARPTHRTPASRPLTKRIIGYCGAHYVCNGRGGYSCTGDGCDCAQVDGAAIEKRVWERVEHMVLNPERLKAASESWTALSESAPEDHSRRLAELNKELEELAAGIEAMTPTAALQAARRGLRGTEAQEAVERALRPLVDQQTKLLALREEAASWQQDAAQAAQQSENLERLAELAGQRIAVLTEEERGEVMDFLRLRVQILGPVPRKTRKDDAISDWFRSNGRVVPSLTDDAWALVKPIFDRPSAGRRPGDPRLLLNALLYKARTGCAWMSIPDGSGKAALASWQRWTKNGRWDELMEALAGVAGTAPPEGGVTLPPLAVYGEIHPDLWIGADMTDGADDLLRSPSKAVIRFRMDLAA